MFNDLPSTPLSGNTDELLEHDRGLALTRLYEFWYRERERLQDAVVELDIDLVSFQQDNGYEQKGVGNRFDLMKAWVEDSMAYEDFGIPDESSLVGLSEAELYLVFVRSELNRAHYLLCFDTLKNSWSASSAIVEGVQTLISCERALFRAEQLIKMQGHDLEH